MEHLPTVFAACIPPQSLNGVLLNSRRLVSKQPTPVSVSDTLQLDQPGKYRYRAVETSERPPPAKRALTRSVPAIPCPLLSPPSLSSWQIKTSVQSFDSCDK